MSEVQDATAQEENPLADLVKSSLDKDYNKANEIFNDVMTVKLADVLDQTKIKLAGQIYNGEPDDEELESEAEDGDNEGTAASDADVESEIVDDEGETDEINGDEEADPEDDDIESDVEDEGDDEIEGAAV